MKAFMLALLATLASASLCSAAPAIAPLVSPPLIRVDWQEPQSLPPRLRNHCHRDAFSGRPYCSDHCGNDYQVYSCSRQSFGCCRVGFGYCDWDGMLRCHP
jgi:hypothetical protein